MIGDRVSLFGEPLEKKLNKEIVLQDWICKKREYERNTNVYKKVKEEKPDQLNMKIEEKKLSENQQKSDSESGFLLVENDEEKPPKEEFSLENNDDQKDENR